MKTQFSIYKTIGQLAAATLMVGMVVMSRPFAGASQAQTPATTPDMPKEDVVKDAGYKTWEDVNDAEGGMVDVFDLAFVASRYNSDNPAADLNNDGKVDIFDLTILASNYGKAAADSQAAAVTPPVTLPQVDAGDKDKDFGDMSLSLEAAQPEVDAQGGGYVWRPLRVGVGIDRVWTWDGLDANNAPDFYAVVSVGGSFVRTATVLNQFDILPYWRLGWWNYNKGFPKFDPANPTGDNYNIPVTLTIRDDDGRTCYGHLGCWFAYETGDLSPVHGQRIKNLRLFPSSCKVVDENGGWTQGYWVNGSPNRCRVPLYHWGNEWPRAAVQYYIDAQWD